MRQNRLTGVILEGQLRHPRGRRRAPSSDAAPVALARRPAKVARMLALAHHIQGAIDRGAIADRAAVARSLGFTRARVTQLLDLLLLAPDLQAQVLYLETVDGIEPIAERALRAIANARTWTKQRQAWLPVALR